MQCSRCDYIRFKSAPKCVNCGFDFKNKKSTHEAAGESENEFTIFAAVGTEAVAVSAGSEMNSQEPLSSPVDSPLVDETDTLEPQETYIQESGDFELNLSEMDNPDSDDWVVGATLTEDMAEISHFDANDPSENSTEESNEFAVQGLGFDATEDTDDMEPIGVETPAPDQKTALDSELTIMDEEMAVQEMEPYAAKSDIGFVQEQEDEDSELSEISVQGIDKTQSLDTPTGDSEEITLETELKLETMDSELDLDREETRSNEAPLDIQDNSIELDPMLELEDLDLALEIETTETGTDHQSASQTTDATLEDLGINEDTGDDNAPFLSEDDSQQD